MARPKKKVVTLGRDPRAMGARCDECPLKGAQPVWGDGPANAKIAVIGEAPGRDEVRAGKPFIGRSGELLDNYLAKVGAPRSTVWTSNALLCFPPGGDLDTYLKVSKKEFKAAGKTWTHPIECCRARLLKELRVPKCMSCGKFVRGPPVVVCTCRSPIPVEPVGGEGPQYVAATGNAALEALTGVSGIMRFRGSMLDMEQRRKRLVQWTPEEKKK